MDRFVAWLAVVVAMGVVIGAPARAQISTPCNASMINAFTPCMNFLTNSSSNGSTSTPTSQCCDSLKSLAAGSMDCLCLLIIAGVPFRVPINRTLAISLPRACQMSGVPVQCKSSGSPLPAPGPAALGPSPSPFSPSGFTPSPSPQASSILPLPTTPSLAPESDTNQLSTPPSPSVATDTPSASSGGRSDLTPSSAILSPTLSPSFLLIALGLVVLKFY